MKNRKSSIRHKLNSLAHLHFAFLRKKKTIDYMIAVVIVKESQTKFADY